MAEITRLLKNSHDYPRNLSRTEKVEHFLESSFEKLDEHENRLFSSRGQADLGLCELGNDSQGGPNRRALSSIFFRADMATAFWRYRVKNLSDLSNVFNTASYVPRADPRCRFLSWLPGIQSQYTS